MSAECIIQEIRQALEGRPGQAIVLGVCQAFANRTHKPAWLLRLGAILLCLLWTLPALAAYVALGFLLPETEQRTRGFFRGLGIVAREMAEKATSALGRLFGSGADSRYRSRSY
jgi:phage shock protein PspC (stress-responsive transcriptional regulator)